MWIFLKRREYVLCGMRDKFVCSVGPVRTGLAGIRDTYSDAFKAIRVMRKLQPENCVCVYEKVEMYCVLQDLFSAGKRDVFERILAPVESREFLETLWTYFMCSGSLDETAGVLHTHRNTVKYRLGRIQAVTGLDIKRPEDGFKLYMGVLAWRLQAHPCPKPHPRCVLACQGGCFCPYVQKGAFQFGWENI